MDDSDDGTYSRAPELEELVGLCQALNVEGARYVLIGGFAVILHGFVRATKEIDACVALSARFVPTGTRRIKHFALVRSGGPPDPDIRVAQR